MGEINGRPSFLFLCFFFLEVLGDEIKLKAIYSSNLVFRSRQIIEKGASNLGLFIFVGAQLFCYTKIFLNGNNSILDKDLMNIYEKGKMEVTQQFIASDEVTFLTCVVRK